MTCWQELTNLVTLLCIGIHFSVRLEVDFRSIYKLLAERSCFNFYKTWRKLFTRLCLTQRFRIVIWWNFQRDHLPTPDWLLQVLRRRLVGWSDWAVECCQSHKNVADWKTGQIAIFVAVDRACLLHWSAGFRPRQLVSWVSHFDGTLYSLCVGNSKKLSGCWRRSDPNVVRRIHLQNESTISAYVSK